MKSKILFGLLCVFSAMSANAAIPYRVQQVVMPAPDNGQDSESFARAHRFYVGGAYNFTLWNSFTDEHDVRANAKNSQGFEAMAGVRVYDVFRLEANYIHSAPEYTAFKLTSNAAMLNAILDARIDSLYRLFYRQHLVPYIGVGAGASWNSADGAHLGNKMTAVVGAMAGLGIEIGEYFTIDVGYRYMYIISPKLDVMSDLNPAGNMFRAGVRINF